jgi:hypothetical protein
VVPAGTTGVVLNVTAVQPTSAGFVSVRPADAPGSPATSSLNFEAGVTQPNAVTVQVPSTGPDAGKIEITYDAYGTAGASTDVLVDVVGYYTAAATAPAPVTKSATLNLPYTSFFPLSDSTGDYSGGSGKIGGNGLVGRFMALNGGPGGHRMVASVQLPHGATITGAAAGVYKNAATGTSEIQLHRVDKETGALEAVAESAMAGVSPSLRTFTAPVDPTMSTVDNDRYLYVFTVTVQNWDETDQVEVVWGSVDYTYTE